MYIYAHNPNSEGAKALKEALGLKRIRNENSKFKGGAAKRVINWGSSSVPEEVAKSKVLNRPEKVALVTNKLKFFKAIEAVDKDIIPPFTTKLEEALNWVGEGFTVVARTVLNGSSGEGIVLMDKNTPETLKTKAPLYVKYVPKKEEYRVHVVNNKVIDIQRKTLSKEKIVDGAEINWKVRNLANGFIYQRGNINPDPSVLETAVKAVKAIGMDFGAVDMVWHEKTKKAYVLEINSAPGLQGQTIESYAKAFKEII